LLSPAPVSTFAEAAETQTKEIAKAAAKALSIRSIMARLPIFLTRNRADQIRRLPHQRRLHVVADLLKVAWGFLGTD
jgi:hypothetical protein